MESVNDKLLREEKQREQQDSLYPTKKESSRHETNTNYNVDEDSNLLPPREESGEQYETPTLPWKICVILIVTTIAQYIGSSTVSLFTYMDLHYDAVEVTRFWMYVGLTSWTMPIIGWLCDVVVVFKERRRPFMLLCVLTNVAFYTLYSLVPAVTGTYATFVAISMVQNVVGMGVYIPLNGLIVELGRHDAESYEESTARMGTLMSQTMVWRTSGSLIGSLMQTLLTIKLSLRQMFLVSAACYTAVAIVALLLPRTLFLRRASANPEGNVLQRAAKTLNRLKNSFNIRDPRSDGVCFVVVLVFVFIYTAMPDASMAYYTYIYNTYFFKTWYYSFNGAVGTLGSICGAAVYAWWMARSARREAMGHARTDIFSVFVLGSVAWSFGYITNIMLCTGFITDTLNIPAAWFIPIDSFVTSAFVRFAFMPTLSMAAEHAPQEFEASAFELFSVASVGGGTVSGLITSFIAQDLYITNTDFRYMWLLLAISAGFKLFPIVLAAFLPERRRTTRMQTTTTTTATISQETDGEHEVEHVIQVVNTSKQL